MLAVGTLRQDLLHLKCDGAFCGYARRGVGQTSRNGNALNLALERLLHFGEQALVFLRDCLGCALFVLGFKAQVAAGNVLELLFVVFVHRHEAELVNVLRAQQHVESLAQHRVYDGALRQTVDGFARCEEDGLLAFGHRLGVLGQRNHLLLLGGIEKQQVGKHILLHAIAGVDTVLQVAAKALEELLVTVAVVLQELLQFALDLLFELVGDSAQLAVLLQRFAGNVQCQILRINNALYEAEVVGQQVGALFHDQHVGAVQRQALFVILVEEVVRRTLGDEQ